MQETMKSVTMAVIKGGDFMFCNRCGTKLPDGARFCQNCGSPVYYNGSTVDKHGAEDNRVRHLPSPKKALAICFASIVVIAAIILAIQPEEKERDVLPKSSVNIVLPPALNLQDAAETEEPPQEVAEADLNMTVDAILSSTEKLEGFVQPDEFYQPLANITDIDGNGIYELLLLYKIELGDRFRVDYSVWRIDGEDCSVLRTDTLYEEVGGNSGYILPVVDAGGNPYLMTVSNSPEGDRFNVTYIYMPWNEEQTVLSDAWVYMEAHGVYGQEDEGEYILGDKRVDRAAFGSRQADFIGYWSTLNLLEGPDSFGGSMSFEQMREYDLTEKTYFTPN